MQQSVIELVKSFGSAFLPRIADSGVIEMFDFGNMARNKQRLGRMRQNGRNRSLDMQAVRAKFNDDNSEKKEKQRQALSHWFEDAKVVEEEALETRLGDLDKRRYNLPAIEPLPSVEDSFLAWSCEDAYMFEGRVVESWRQYGDDETAVQHMPGAANIFSNAENDDDDCVSAPSMSFRARNDFWID